MEKLLNICFQIECHPKLPTTFYILFKISLSATKRHFLAIASNKLRNDVILNWKAPLTSLIVTPIPKNNITMLGMAKRRVFWRFRSFFPINNLEIRAFDKLSGLPVKINGQDVLKTKAFSYKNIVKMSLVFGYPGKHLHLI